MGRVEETNKALTELRGTVIEALKVTSDSHAVIAHVITLHAGVNEEIAKNLAQLADDIHFLRETVAKELERDDKDEVKSNESRCSRCAYHEKTTVDDNGLIRNDVDWCMWYRRPIDPKKDVDCYKFIRECEAKS